MTSDLIARLRTRPMNAFQISAVAVCVALNMLDGFDVLAMSFAAPSVREAWNLPPDRLGLLFSAGLFGMAIGSVGIAPLSDRFGRRPIIILCLGDMLVGMMLAALAPSVAVLLASRVMTGLGLGGLLASMNTLVAEYTPDHRRDFALGLMVAGYPIGATLGGLASVWLVDAFDWRAVFWLGAGVAAVLLPITILYLPKSLDLLLIRRGRNALARVNALLKRLGEPEIAALPPAPVHASGAGALELFAPKMLRSTALICACFLAVFMVNLFIISWLPTLLRDLGLEVSGAISYSVINYVGAAVGGVAVGMLSSKFSMRIISPVFMIGTLATVMLFAVLPGPLWLILCVIAAIGVFGNGCSTTLYTIAPRVFPARLRATGTGLAIGFGRLGGIVSPYLAGVLMGMGWQKPLYSFVICLPLLLSALFVTLIREIGGGKKSATSKTALGEPARS